MAEFEEVPFQDLVDFKEGPGILAKDFRDQGVPLLRLKGLSSPTSVLEGCNHLDPAMVAARWSHFRVSPGDLLLSTSASLGRVAVVGPEAEGAVPYTGIIRMRAKPPLRQDFLRYVLQGGHFQAQVTAMGVGSVMNHFGPSHLRRMSLLVPPEAQQAGIADLLGALDDKIAVDRRTIADLDELAQLLYESEASGAQRRRLVDLREDRVLTFGDGYRTKASELGPSGHPILRVADVADGFVRRLSGDHVRAELVRRCPDKVAVQGDVVVTTKGTVGRAALVEATHVGAVYSPQVCYLRSLSKEVSPSIVLRWARSGLFKRQAAALQGQTDMADYINLRDFGSLEMPVVPASSAVVRQLAALDGFAAGLRSEISTLAEMRSALLPVLLSGELRVRAAKERVEAVG